MAWNEPKDDEKKPSDDHQKPKDPWKRPEEDGPPDLDEVFNDLKNKLGGIFGGNSSNNRDSGFKGFGGDDSQAGGSGNNNNRPSDNIQPTLPGGRALLLFALVPLGLWLASGIYTVDEGKRGVVTQFGRYVSTAKPGLRYHLPSPIQSVQIVDTQRVRFLEIGYRGGGSAAQRSVSDESLMLTADENIVDVKLSVQYQISDPKDYLFNVTKPDETLFEVIESITREVVGDSTMDFVLTEGRSDIVNEIKSKSQYILNEQYKTGLTISDVNLQDAQPPEQVQEAFNDAIRAREDEQRLKNQAQAYRNAIIPQARGEAAAMLEQAEAYKASAIAAAEGEAARFEALLTEYEAAPEVTRQRLYLETMEQVMQSSKKVIMPEQGNNIMMLPLQDMLSGSAPNQATMAQPSAPATPNASSSTGTKAATTQNPSTGGSNNVRSRER